MLKSRITLLCFILISFHNCLAQKFSLGIQAGFDNTFRDDKINKHVNYAIFIHVPFASSWSLKTMTEYFQKKHYSSQWETEFRGTTYIARDAQLWQSYSLNLFINRKIYKAMYIGTGISCNLIEFKKHAHDPFWPFIFTWDDKVKPNRIADRDVYLIRPGVLSVLGWEGLLWRKLNLFVEMRYAILFVGKEFGHGSLNLLESVAFWAGLNFKL